MPETSITADMWRLNERMAPEALNLSERMFSELAQRCDYRFELKAGPRLSAFALAMSSNQAIDHVSYQWFMTRFDDFVYLDRIVVDNPFFRQGLGTQLLEACVAKAHNEHKTLIVCQVHDRPSNKVGHLFAQSMEFHAIESVMLPSREIVTMYQRSIAIATP